MVVFVSSYILPEKTFRHKLLVHRILRCFFDNAYQVEKSAILEFTQSENLEFNEREYKIHCGNTLETEETVGIMENTKNKENVEWKYEIKQRGNQGEGIRNSQQRILNEGLRLPYIRQFLGAKINGAKPDCEIVHDMSIAITFR